MSTAIMWSGGKDSTATVILAHEHNIPIDYILMAEVMFDHKRGISGENPEHIKWVYEVAIPKFERWGYKVIVVKSTEDYVSLFYRQRIRKNKGKMYGWFIQGGCMGNSMLKITPLNKVQKNLNITDKIVGITIDEPVRLERAKRKLQRSLLAEYGYTEQMSLELCEKHNLLSPIYRRSFRGGCWFCPNASIKQHAYIKQIYPYLWRELAAFDEYHTNNRSCFFDKNEFAKGGRTFKVIDQKVDDFICKEQSELSLFKEDKQ